LYGLIPITSSSSSSSSSSFEQQQPQWKQITISFNQGDMVIFRGNFIHAGADYPCTNVRIHYYCEVHKSSARVDGKAYKIDIDDRLILKIN
jgi:hypothetical protein